ncbi:hypothetical protein HDU77_006414 [Chytriomyces hyalinus]|nr:hypothetical protein HDU77_006414 [Chytriomyces hyalinus]
MATWHTATITAAAVAALGVSLVLANPMRALVAIFNTPIGFYAFRRIALGGKNKNRQPHCTTDSWDNSHHGIRIIPVPYASDNYGYIIHDQVEDIFVLVDSADTESFHRSLRAASPTGSVVAILTTHHHWDHSSGNAIFKASDTENRIDVYGSHIDFPVNGFTNRGWHRVNKQVGDGERFKIGRMTFAALLVSCHTRGHLIYTLESVPSSTATKEEPFQPSAFTGDAFFVGGCGRFFEGSGTDMHTLVAKCVAEIAPNTLIWPGHEYALSNLAFAARFEPGNVALQAKLKEAESKKESKTGTIPSLWAAELAHNPFLRVQSKVRNIELWDNIIRNASSAKRIGDCIKLAQEVVGKKTMGVIDANVLKEAEAEMLTALRQLKDTGKL